MYIPIRTHRCRPTPTVASAGGRIYWICRDGLLWERGQLIYYIIYSLPNAIAA